MADPLTEAERWECEGLLAMFSPERPLVASPILYQEMLAKGLSMENVVERKPLPAWEFGS